MPLKNMTPLDAVQLPEVQPLPLDNPAWPSLSEPAKALCAKHVELGQKARALAEAYRDLFREAEALRAERDALLARLHGQPATAH